MVSGGWKLFSLLQLLLLLLIHAEDVKEPKGEMAMHTSGMLSEEEEMGKGPLPECFEEDKAYIGYAMNIIENNTETGDRYVSGCPNPQHCQMMCQEAEGCEWFNWSNSTCPMTGNVMTRCWMKRGKGRAMEKTGVITGPKYCKQKENRHCIERNRMYIGDGLNVWKRRVNNFGRQKTASHCQDLCKRTRGCRWFNWNAKSECWLKRSHGQQKRANVRLEPGVSTGPRECPRIPAKHSCEEGWHYFEGSCFLVNIKLDNATLSYADVSELCRDQGASLVCFQSQQEFNFVTDMMDRNHWQQQGLDFWVGATRSSSQEEFRWEVDNTPAKTRWAHGEPKDHKCLQLFRDGADNWVYKTDNCEERDEDGSYICEKPANTKSDESATGAIQTMMPTEAATDPTTQDSFAAEPTVLPSFRMVPEDTGHEVGSGFLADAVEDNACATLSIDNGMMSCTDESDCHLTCAPGYTPYPHSLYRCGGGMVDSHGKTVDLEDIKCSPAKAVIGGCSTSDNQTLIQISDSKETCSIAPLPGDGKCHTGYTLGFVDGELLACGGTLNPTKCLRYNYFFKNWTEAANLNVRRMESVSVVIGNKMHIIGGVGTDKIETVSFNSALEIFESNLNPNLITYPVTNEDCVVGVLPDTIISLTSRDQFFSYNLSSGLADDLVVDFPRNAAVPCVLYRSSDSGIMAEKLMVANGIDNIDEIDIYDIDSKAWTSDSQTSFTSGHLINIEGGEVLRISMESETAEGRTFHYNPVNHSWELYDSKMSIEQSSVPGPVATVPSHLFTCERFGLP